MWLAVGTKIISNQEGPTMHAINDSLQAGQPGWRQAQWPKQNQMVANKKLNSGIGKWGGGVGGWGGGRPAQNNKTRNSKIYNLGIIGY